jgi:hypothetical protein
METLTKLQQSGLFEEYKSQFEVLAHRVHDLPKHHKLSCFLGGFKPEIRFPVIMFNTQTLVDANTLAKIQEENILNNIKSNRALWVPNHYRSNNQGGSAEIAMGFNRNSGFVGNKSQLQGNQGLGFILSIN